MAATRASGTNAVRYGTMRENVLGLTVVTADGRIIRTGGRARKSSAGYDLTRLFVGQEGTLGIITEIQLRLYGVPEAISAAVCQFDDLRSRGADGDPRDAARASRSRASSSWTTCRWVRASRYSKLEGFEAKPTLFFEFHGTERRRARAGRADGGDRRGPRRQRVRVGDAAEDRSKLWKARHNA